MEGFLSPLGQNNIPTISTEQMNEIIRLMTEIYGISFTQMMENAGFNLAFLANRMCGGSVTGRKICIAVGGGNKGGTGLVSARHLSNWGAEVVCLLIKTESEFKCTVLQQLETVRQLPVSVVAMGIHSQYIEWHQCELIIDAMIGSGLSGEADRESSHIINRINDTRCPVLSLDTPSGLNPCTGYISEHVVRAASTLTLALPKQGLILPDARQYVGEIYLVDISVPPLLYKQIGLNFEHSLFGNKTIVAYPL